MKANQGVENFKVDPAYNRCMQNTDLTQVRGWQRITHYLGWNRTSYFLISAFLLTIFLILYIWWPLAEEYLSYIDWDGHWWLYIDWLLVGIFLVMSLLIMAGANLRGDTRLILVGLLGGLVIESWGTQTEIWTYYTAERPPLWIIPAWPIATLSIDRLVRLFDRLLPLSDRLEKSGNQIFRMAYWVILVCFYGLMSWFVAPTLNKPYTWIALLLSGIFIIAPADRRLGLLTFLAGSGLGYFLELWGTTRGCWIYYTLEQPPLFAVLAHGMAALAFWRTNELLAIGWGRLRAKQWSGIALRRRTLKRNLERH